MSDNDIFQGDSDPEAGTLCCGILSFFFHKFQILLQLPIPSILKVKYCYILLN